MYKILPIVARFCSLLLHFFRDFADLAVIAHKYMIPNDISLPSTRVGASKLEHFFKTFERLTTLLSTIPPASWRMLAFAPFPPKSTAGELIWSRLVPPRGKGLRRDGRKFLEDTGVADICCFFSGDLRG